MFFKSIFYYNRLREKRNKNKFDILIESEESRGDEVYTDFGIHAI
jgi:preprotein translocase subunit YajC